MCSIPMHWQFANQPATILDRVLHMQAFQAWNTINNVKLTSGGDEVAIIPGLGYETIVPSVETDLENPNRICCSHYWCQIRNNLE